MAGTDRDDFEAFYREHVAAVFAYACSRASRGRASEIVGETFLVAWRRRDQVSAESPRAWLLGVARRLAANERRASDRQQALALRIAAMHAGEPGGGDPADEVVGRASALNALAGMSSDDRELLVLTAWSGLTPSDAAKVLGCSRAALLMRLHRARQRFSKALADDEPTPPRTAEAEIEIRIEKRAPSILPKEQLT